MMGVSEMVVFDLNGVKVTKIRLHRAVLTEIARNVDADPAIVEQAMAYAPKRVQSWEEASIGDPDTGNEEWICSLFTEEEAE